MGASGLNVAHAPCRRYGGRYGGLAYVVGATVGSLTVVSATVSCPSHCAALPPVVHERYGELTPPCEQLCMGTPVNKIKYNCKNI